MLKSNVKPSSKLKNKLSIVMMILFFVGMLYGSITAGGTAGDLLSDGITAMADKRATQTVFETFCTTFGKNMLFLGGLYLAGYCAVGQPIALFLPLLFGLGVGATMGGIYKAMLWQGIVYCILLILPHTVVALSALILGARESFLMSNLFLGSAIERFGGDLSKHTLKLYTLKFLILTGIMLAGALADALLTFMFQGLFV